jgi:hypothetical protein
VFAETRVSSNSSPERSPPAGVLMRGKCTRRVQPFYSMTKESSSKENVVCLALMSLPDLKARNYLSCASSPRYLSKASHAGGERTDGTSSAKAERILANC